MIGRRTQVFGESNPTAADDDAASVSEAPTPAASPPDEELAAAAGGVVIVLDGDGATPQVVIPEAQPLAAAGGWLQRARALLLGPKAPEGDDFALRLDTGSGAKKKQAEGGGGAEAAETTKGSMGAKMRWFWATVDRALDDGSNKPLPGAADDGASSWSPTIGKARAATPP